MTSDELDLIETSILADALYRRVGESGSVLVALVESRTEQKELFQCFYRGGLTASMGLAMRAYENLLKDCCRFEE